MLIGIGAVCVLRMFWIPLTLIIDYSNYLKDPTNIGKLGPTVVGQYVNNAYFWQNGYVRGITTIVLLGIAAACFFFAGIIGLIRAKKYADFMATQDTTKGV